MWRKMSMTPSGSCSFLYSLPAFISVDSHNKGAWITKSEPDCAREQIDTIPASEIRQSMTHSSVDIQIASEVVPSVPCWFGEVAIVAQLFKTSGLLQAIEQRVRFTRRRFGIYEVLDFVVVLIGYAVSAEPTLETFYERLSPFAPAFIALFGRNSLPHRSTLSRFLAALDQPTVEALCALFLEDLVVRTAQTFPPGGLWDRLGHHWLVMDVDGTKQAARQRALPSGAERPSPHRRFDRTCAPGYLGRKHRFFLERSFCLFSICLLLARCASRGRPKRSCPCSSPRPICWRKRTSRLTAPCCGRTWCTS